jgi:hypothetical protein
VLIPIAPTANQSSLQVSAVQSISYPSINFPDGFGFVASDILSLIESEVSSHLQSSAVGQVFPLLTYPSSIVGPSSPLQADMGVDETSIWCSFYNADDVIISTSRNV